MTYRVVQEIFKDISEELMDHVLSYLIPDYSEIHQKCIQGLQQVMKKSGVYNEIWLARIAEDPEYDEDPEDEDELFAFTPMRFQHDYFCDLILHGWIHRLTNECYRYVNWIYQHLESELEKKFEYLWLICAGDNQLRLFSKLSKKYAARCFVTFDNFGYPPGVSMALHDHIYTYIIYQYHFR
jgi:tRNA-dihydrouridine synthase